MSENNSYSFKRFTKVGSKLSNYTISFNGKSLTFGFNGGFYTREKISSYKKVVLFFDDKKKAIAFLFTNNENEKGAFTIIHGNESTTGSVTAHSFVSDNNLKDQRYFGKMEPKKITDKLLGEIFVIDLLGDKK